MADSTTPTDPKPDRYVLEASINAAGELMITGPELCDDTLEVTLGNDVVVVIQDTDDYYLYGTQLVANGERAHCWGRNTERGCARRKFSTIREEADNLIFAVSTRDTATIKYGPVIKVKPKG